VSTLVGGTRCILEQEGGLSCAYGTFIRCRLRNTSLCVIERCHRVITLLLPPYQVSSLYGLLFEEYLASSIPQETDIQSKMQNEDEVSLLEEPLPWQKLKQKSQRYSWSLVLLFALVFSSFGFLFGIAIGPYWSGRLDLLCLAKTSMPCE
jgi:hypothetical protein